MVKELQQPPENVTYDYYYDTHTTKEELMPTASIHELLVEYIKLILRWMFRERRAAVYSELNFYVSTEHMAHAMVPDVAVILGVEFQKVPSWSVVRTGLPPQVVFEIASPETWIHDVEEKPGGYGLMGVSEYFFYAPDPLVLGKQFVFSQLLGWQWNQTTGKMEQMQPDEQGRLWSQQLESYLVPDGTHVRFFDRWGHLRLTGEEAERQAKEIERQAKEAALQRVEALVRQLRALGINPDEQ